MSKRLLPAESPEGTPAFTLKVSGDLQNLLSRNSLRLKLIVNDGKFALKAGNQVYEFDTHNDKNPTEVFEYLSQSTLRSMGSVQTRLQINTPISSPESSASSSTVSTEREGPAKKSSPPPTHQHQRTGSTGNNSPPLSGASHATIMQRTIHILSLCPRTLDQLVKLTNIPARDLEPVLKEIAVRADYKKKDPVVTEYPRKAKIERGNNINYYALRYNYYKDIKLYEGKYKEADIPLLKKNCISVFDHLRLSPYHPARVYIMSGGKKGGDHGSLKNKVSSPSPEKKHSDLRGLQHGIPKGPKLYVEQQEVKKEPVEVKAEKPRHSPPTYSTPPIPMPTPKARAEREKPAELAPKAPVVKESTTQPKKRKAEDDLYLHELAERFQNAYKEYEVLYKAVIDKEQQQKRDSEEVKKLFDLHKNLESWKKQLWNSVPTE